MTTGCKHGSVALVGLVAGPAVVAGFSDKALTVTGGLTLTAVFLGITLVACVRPRCQRRPSGR